MRRRTALVLMVALGAGLALATSASATHPRPGSATPLRMPLVPVAQECAGSANASHVPPIASPSCSPPSGESDILGLGSVGLAHGFMKLRVFCLAPETAPPCTSGDGEEEMDVSVEMFQSDVRCLKVAPGCLAIGADYQGALIEELPMRITDHSVPGVGPCPNGGGGAPCTVATVEDIVFAFIAPTGACTPTQTVAGSTCSFTTTLNAQVPGMVKEGLYRAVIAITGLEITDVGEDGDPGPDCPWVCGTGDETRFAGQGLFLP